MNRVIRFYNQNRRTIWTVVIIVAFLFGLLQLLNYYAKNNTNDDNTILNTSTSVKNEYTDVKVSSNESILSQNNLTSTQEKYIEAINTFYNYCNNSNYKEAYEMLTDECKENLYTTADIFKENYYDSKFNGMNKTISVENWTDNIYKVDINVDALSTGTYDASNNIQEYVSVVEVDSQYKLNVNDYIGKTEINKTVEDYDLSITVVEKNVYMDYEIYTFSIKNNSSNTILLNNLEDTDSIYLEDDNDLKYTAYLHELSVTELMVSPGQTRDIKIKFYNKFSSEREIESVEFTDVILNYDIYVNFENKNDYNYYAEFNLEL